MDDQGLSAGAAAGALDELTDDPAERRQAITSSRVYLAGLVGLVFVLMASQAIPDSVAWLRHLVMAAACLVQFVIMFRYGFAGPRRRLRDLLRPCREGLMPVIVLAVLVGGAGYFLADLSESQPVAWWVYVVVAAGLAGVTWLVGRSVTRSSAGQAA